MPDGGKEETAKIGEQLVVLDSLSGRATRENTGRKSWQRIIKRQYADQVWDDRITGRLTALEVYTLGCGLVGARPCDAETGETAYNSRVPTDVFSGVDLGDGWQLSYAAALDAGGERNTISYLESGGLSLAISGQQAGGGCFRSEIQLDQEGTPVRVVGKRYYESGRISGSLEITLSSGGDNTAHVQISQNGDQVARRIDFEFGAEGQLQKVRLASNDLPKQPGAATETDFFGRGQKDYREWAGNTLRDSSAAEIVNGFLGIRCERADLVRLDLGLTLRKMAPGIGQSGVRIPPADLVFMPAEKTPGIP